MNGNKIGVNEKKKKKMVKNQRGHLSQCKTKRVGEWGSGGGTSEMD